MAMVKTFSAAGWNWGCQVTSLVKVASGGLRGHDRREFVKRASGSESIFLPYLDQVKFADDEEPAHFLTVGAKERWGSNRNGDAFKIAACEKYHDTFVKFGRQYRNHQNKDPQKSYGIIKLSAYNPAMHRIELLVALNKTAAAAERNGGLIADKELEKLARGDDIAVSMACRVPYDVCGICGHKARTRDEYCKEASCPGGGCFDNLTRLVKTASGDLVPMHVDNDHPSFFDNSMVWRPAERTAYGGRADYLLKAAADGFDGNFGVGGAKMAEDLGILAPQAVILAQDTAPRSILDSAVLGDQVKLAFALDCMEKSAEFALPVETRRAFSTDVQPTIDFEKLDAVTPEKTAAALMALADQTVIVPLREFAKLTKRAELAPVAIARMPGVYGRMLNDGSMRPRLEDSPYVTAQSPSGRQKMAAARLSGTHGLSAGAVNARVTRSIVSGAELPKDVFEIEKSAADGAAAESLARDYAVYAVGALHRIAQSAPEFVLTSRLLACQNRCL